MLQDIIFQKVIYLSIPLNLHLMQCPMGSHFAWQRITSHLDGFCHVELRNWLLKEKMVKNSKNENTRNILGSHSRMKPSPLPTTSLWRSSKKPMPTTGAPESRRRIVSHSPGGRRESNTAKVPSEKPLGKICIKYRKNLLTNINSRPDFPEFFTFFDYKFLIYKVRYINLVPFDSPWIALSNDTKIFIICWFIANLWP